jgi:hypothetical protein
MADDRDSGSDAEDDDYVPGEDKDEDDEAKEDVKEEVEEQVGPAPSVVVLLRARPLKTGTRLADDRGSNGGPSVQEAQDGRDV